MSSGTRRRCGVCVCVCVCLYKVEPPWIASANEQIYVTVHLYDIVYAFLLRLVMAKRWYEYTV